jgi:hypothetical protein
MQSLSKTTLIAFLTGGLLLQNMAIGQTQGYSKLTFYKAPANNTAQEAMNELDGLEITPNAEIDAQIEESISETSETIEFLVNNRLNMSYDEARVALLDGFNSILERSKNAPFEYFTRVALKRGLFLAQKIEEQADVNNQAGIVEEQVRLLWKHLYLAKRNRIDTSDYEDPSSVGDPIPWTNLRKSRFAMDYANEMIRIAHSIDDADAGYTIARYSLEWTEAMMKSSVDRADFFSYLRQLTKGISAERQTIKAGEASKNLPDSEFVFGIRRIRKVLADAVKSLKEVNVNGSRTTYVQVKNGAVPGEASDIERLIMPVNPATTPGSDIAVFTSQDLTFQQIGISTTSDPTAVCQLMGYSQVSGHPNLSGTRRGLAIKVTPGTRIDPVIERDAPLMAGIACKTPTKSNSKPVMTVLEGAQLVFKLSNKSLPYSMTSDANIVCEQVTGGKSKTGYAAVINESPEDAWEVTRQNRPGTYVQSKIMTKVVCIGLDRQNR